MFCSKCGAENPEGTKFCTTCGAEGGASTKPTTFALAMTPVVGMFIAVAIGLLLRIIGMHEGEAGLIFVGTFILPLSLIWGGLFLKGQELPVRAALLVTGGLALLLGTMPLVPDLPW